MFDGVIVSKWKNDSLCSGVRYLVSVIYIR